MVNAMTIASEDNAPPFGTEQHIWTVLEGVPDPEIPALSVVDLGIVRGVCLAADGSAIVRITPTYSGCPATDFIAVSIEGALDESGYSVTVRTVLSPPWSTADMSEAGRHKLKEYGIAPPSRCGTRGAPSQITCPQCGSNATRLVSEFGSTACKALFSCGNCLEPFEYFKCI